MQTRTRVGVAQEGAVIADVGAEMKAIAQAWREGNLEDTLKRSCIRKSMLRRGGLPVKQC